MNGINSVSGSATNSRSVDLIENLEGMDILLKQSDQKTVSSNSSLLLIDSDLSVDQPVLKISSEKSSQSMQRGHNSGVNGYFNQIDWSRVADKVDSMGAKANRLIVGVSSGALFDMRVDHELFKKEGKEAFRAFQIEHEDDPFLPGEAFNLVRKLLALNEQLDDEAAIEVVVISKNSPQTSIRVLKSIEHYELPISRAGFTSGRSPFGYAKAFESQLYLSTNPKDVKQAIDAGIAAATLLPSERPSSESLLSNSLREKRSEYFAGGSSPTINIAFDGDAVIFSDEAERVNKQEGLVEFYRSEKANAKQPMREGPMKPFLEALSKIKAHDQSEEGLIRIAVVTARGTLAHERVVRTLRSWGINVDECLFLAGRDKTPFLQAFSTDIYFDDKESNCLSAQNFVTTGHVPFGILNEERDTHEYGDVEVAAEKAA